MRHEEENHWHPSDRHRHDNRRNSSRYHEDNNFNHFGNRWGEPDPRFAPGRYDSWQEEQLARERNRRRDPRDDWSPFEPRLEDQYRRHQGHDNRNNQHREPEWRQRDRHFNSNNQHANDRWQNDDSMPHPDQEGHRYQEDRRRRRH